MKTLSLKVEKGDLNLPNDTKDKSPQELIFLAIKTIIRAYANDLVPMGQGLKMRNLNDDERRLYYKIQDAFEEVLKVGENGAPMPDTIELEDNWMGFISKCRKETTFMPDNLLRQTEQLIDAVKDR